MVRGVMPTAVAGTAVLAKIVAAPSIRVPTDPIAATGVASALQAVQAIGLTVIGLTAPQRTAAAEANGSRPMWLPIAAPYSVSVPAPSVRSGQIAIAQSETTKNKRIAASVVRNIRAVKVGTARRNIATANAVETDSVRTGTARIHPGRANAYRTKAVRRKIVRTIVVPANTGLCAAPMPRAVIVRRATTAPAMAQRAKVITLRKSVVMAVAEKPVMPGLVPTRRSS
jgi:hypothetical protein